MKKEYIMTVDQSTSGTKVILVDKQGHLIDKISKSHKQYYPQPGWVEHDPGEIYENTVTLIKKLVGKNSLSAVNIKCLGITNQRESIVVWDKNTGKPVYNAVVWQCQRGKDICNNYKKKGYEELINKKTGLLLDPYFSASKIKWVLDNIPNVKKEAEKGNIIFGTVDSWLIWKLTKGEVHATDYSNASRTMLFNINKLEWDKELFELFDIPISMAPEVRSSNSIFAYTDIENLFKNKTPISGIIGDSHAALFGQTCFERGTAKATYGTGSSIVMNIGKEYQKSNNGIVTSLAWGIDDVVDYIFEGNVHSTGATIKWLYDNLELFDDYTKIEELGQSIDDNNGVYFVPAFVGLGAPYWINDVTATITGITFATNKTHLIRSALEAIAYQIKDVLDLMVKESGIQLKELRVDGGPTRNDFLMQFQSDILDVPVNRIKIEEISALGSTFMAGLAVGFWESLDEIKGLRDKGFTFHCNMDKEIREKNYLGWKKAVKKTITKEEVNL